MVKRRVLAVLCAVGAMALATTGCDLLGSEDQSDSVDSSGPYRVSSIEFMDSNNTLSRSDDDTLIGEVVFPGGSSPVGTFEVAIRSDGNADGDVVDPRETVLEAYVYQDADTVGMVTLFENLDDDGLYDDKVARTQFTNGFYGYISRTTEYDNGGDKENPVPNGTFGDATDTPSLRRVRTYTSQGMLQDEEFFLDENADGTFAPEELKQRQEFTFDASGNPVAVSTYVDADADGQVNDLSGRQTYTYSGGHLTEILSEDDTDGDGALDSRATAVYEYDDRGLIEYGYFDWGGDGPVWSGYFTWEEGDCIIRGEDVIMSVNTDGFFCFTLGLE